VAAANVYASEALAGEPLRRRNSIYLLYWYKSTNTDSFRALAEVSILKHDIEALKRQLKDTQAEVASA
jgi:hypothetical protein